MGAHLAVKHILLIKSVSIWEWTSCRMLRLSVEAEAVQHPVIPALCLRYGVMLTDGTILPFVNNLSDFAGLPGRTITGIAIKVNKGTVKYRVHVKGKGWLPYVTGCNWSDANNGYAGYPGAVIDAVEVYYDTPADIVAKIWLSKSAVQSRSDRRRLLSVAVRQ